MAIFILGPDPNGNCCGCEGRTSPCDSCGGTTGCGCLLYTPLSTNGAMSRYSSYATAASNLAAIVTDCYLNKGGGTSATLSLNMPDYIDFLVSRSSALAFWQFESSISITTNLTTLDLKLAASFSLSQSSQRVSIYQCTALPPDSTQMTLIAESTTITSATQTFALPAGGTYTIIFEAAGNGANPSMNCRVGGVSSGQVKAVNPVVAFWNDAGAYRPLEACPKMLLPPLTESTGTWYASEAATQAVINDATSACIAYNPNSGSTSSFSAVNGGTSATINASTAVSAGVQGWISVNALAGETLTETYSGSVGSGNAIGGMVIYDYNGELVQIVVDFFGSGSITSSSLPYTGRYIVLLAFGSDDSGSTSTSGVMTITSSSTMSVNNIQALWDSGADCPRRLNC